MRKIQAKSERLFVFFQTTRFWQNGVLYKEKLMDTSVHELILDIDLIVITQ